MFQGGDRIDPEVIPEVFNGGPEVSPRSSRGLPGYPSMLPRAPRHASMVPEGCLDAGFRVGLRHDLWSFMVICGHLLVIYCHFLQHLRESGQKTCKVIRVGNHI